MTYSVALCDMYDLGKAVCMVLDRDTSLIPPKVVELINDWYGLNHERCHEIMGAMNQVGSTPHSQNDLDRINWLLSQGIAYPAIIAMCRIQGYRERNAIDWKRNGWRNTNYMMLEVMEAAYLNRPMSPAESISYALQAIARGSVGHEYIVYSAVRSFLENDSDTYRVKYLSARRKLKLLRERISQ